MEIRTMGSPASPITSAWTGQPFTLNHENPRALTVSVNVADLTGTATAALEWTTDRSWPPASWQAGQSANITATGATDVALTLSDPNPVVPSPRYMRLTLTPNAASSVTVAGITVQS